jgi:hypothetical protein
MGYFFILAKASANALPIAAFCGALTGLLAGLL